MRSRVDEAIRQASTAEVATIRAQAAGDDRARALEAELAAADDRARALEAELAAARAETQSAAAYARNLESSTSWRVTAPLRAISRTLLRRP
jgi:predicted  nucleic acid-binding Zn-ribbon protein